MPENWKKYRLGDLIEVNKISIRKGDLDWINYIDIKSVGIGFYEEPKKMNFEDAPSRARRLLQEGDTVISSVRPNLRSYFFSQNLKENTIASTGFAVLTPKNIDKRFLYYLTTNDYYINYLVQSCTGSAYPAFGPQVLLDSEVLIPESIQEQKSIASILSTLDDKIELNLQMNKTLEEMAMALYKHWFVDFGPFQDWEFVDSELGEIPKGWEVKKLSEITTELRRGISPKYTEGDGINVINQRCVRNHLIDFSLTRKHDTNKKKVDGRLLELGDVLVNSTGVGTLGRIASVIDLKEEAVVDSHVTVVRANKDYFKLNVFARLMFHIEPVIEAMGEGSTGQTELSRVALGELKVIVPSVQQQKELEDQLEIFSATIVNNLDNIKTLTQLRDTLLPKLISGEVRVKDVEKTLSEVL